MLIILAIIGVLLGVGVSGVQTLIRENRVAAVREAAVKLQSDLENLRSSAIRYNIDSTIRNISSQSYELRIPSPGPSNTVVLRTVTRTLPSNLLLSSTGTFPLTYQAPLSTVDVGARELRITTTGSIGISVRIIGVTGKAVLTGVN
jgi:Tfp pilus assembly protein FimT